jgi:3-mercaptopyruvate sulfurtransferase SseA
MPTAVTATPAAPSDVAEAHFATEFAFETDCWDVHEFLGECAAFVLVDVRSPKLYARSHIPGAINLPHKKITEARMREWPNNTQFFTYRAGPDLGAS